MASQTLLYAVSHFGKALLWVAADTFTLYYLLDICRFPPVEIGWFFLALLLWSAACDSMVGWFFDLLSPTAGQLRAMICMAAVLAAIGFAGAFAVPSANLLGWIWLGTASITFRTAYSLFDVPHNALLSRLVESGAGAMSLSSARLALNMIATLAITAASPWLLVRDLTASRATFASMAAALAVLSATAIVVGTPRLEPKPNGIDEALVARTMPIGVMFAVATISALLVSLLFKSVFYFASYTLAHPDWAPRALMLATAGKLLGSIAWGVLARNRIGALDANRYACLATLATSLALMAALEHVWAIELGILLLGFSLSGTVIAPWAALADRGARGGTIGAAWFGTFTALSKIGIGTSGWCLAFLLARLHIVPGHHAEPYQGHALFLISVAILAGGAGLCLVLLVVGTRVSRRRSSV